jgi:hypothetical protein
MNNIHGANLGFVEIRVLWPWQNTGGEHLRNRAEPRTSDDSRNRGRPPDLTRLKPGASRTGGPYRPYKSHRGPRGL